MFEIITMSAAADQAPFEPFITIKLESPNLMTAGEIDECIGRLGEELHNLRARAKQALATVIANDPHRRR